jgi:hypothetical protein
MDKAERIGWAVIGCGALAFVGIAAAVVVGVVVATRRSEEVVARPQNEPTKPDMRPRSTPWAKCPPANRQARGASIEAPLTVPNAHRVDIADVFAQAKALVVRLEPTAQLTGISGTGFATQGTYDLSASNLSINFEYRCLDGARPPGMDRHQGHALALIEGSKITAHRVEIAAGLLDAFAPFEGQPCSTALAFRAAVASQVPSDARATFVLSPVVEGRWVWRIDVPGHPDYKREVDATTCALSDSPR